MSGAKEIRSKIKSIQSTQKITKAMEMVAASKMRRAQERMRAARPYAEKMRNVVAHLASARSEYRHPYVEERAVRRVGFVVVSTDRGLCGGLNVNLFRMLVREMASWHDQGAQIDLSIIGSKGLAFFRRLGGNIVSQASHLGDAPPLSELIGILKVMLDAYETRTLDRVFLVYNEFVNTMIQRGAVEQLIPLEPDTKTALARHWDYIYEPESRSIVDALMTRYIESLVYQGVVENIACEQAARMVAMKSASDNAGHIIEELSLAYNKARQAAITQEISEIVGGAAAV